MTNSIVAKLPTHKRVRLFLKALGPGVIGGAADDDPSGIGTYSIAGAQLGTSLLWTALLTWPLMAATQMMCARIGMVTGKGLAANLQDKFPKSIMVLVCFSLFLANTLNVGADLAAMSDAAEMLSGISSHIWVFVFGLGIAWATIKLRYFQIARVLKWLAVFLLSYVAVAIIVKPDWTEVLHDTFIPSFPSGKEEWSMIVAILGTTISPYLFFWQASQEVEEEKAAGRKSLKKRIGATAEELVLRKFDVGVGTLFSNLVMFFIILSTALTLHHHGIRDIQTTRQAAESLAPLAGRFASLLFTFGLLGVGFLAIPTLTGSAAYALAETFDWDQGLDAKLNKAQAFYSVIIFSTLLAIGFDFAEVSPMKALYWSAVANGLLAPFLLVGIVIVASDRKLMQGQPSSQLGRAVVWTTAAAMFAAAIAMFAL